MPAPPRLEDPKPGGRSGPAGRPGRPACGRARRPAAVPAAIALAILAWAAFPASAGAAPGDPPRIISLYAADTEILLRLGARDRLVGISRQETYDGPETAGWERPTAFSIHDDVEKFLAASPDWVLLRPQHLATKPELFDALERFGIRLWTRQVTKAADLFDFWLELGTISGREPEARAMIEGFRRDLEAASAPAGGPRPGVFLESIHREVKTFTPESIPIWLLTLAGGRNVAADARPPRPGLIVADYGPERILEKAAEIEILISQEGPMNPETLEAVRGRDIYRVLPAVRDGRVYRVPEELISRPTPSLLEGLAMMGRQIRGGSVP
jgi:iron complex transport system substrate-binding protein